jgi:hypothetical protein
VFGKEISYIDIYPSPPPDLPFRVLNRLQKVNKIFCSRILRTMQALWDLPFCLQPANPVGDLFDMGQQACYKEGP